MSTAIEAEKTHRRLSGLKKNGLVPRSFKGNEILDHLVGNPKTHVFHVDEGTCTEYMTGFVRLNHDLTDNQGNKYHMCKKCIRDYEVFDILDACYSEGYKEVIL